MTKGYRELVGLQVSFSQVAPTYRIEHFYKWKQDGVTSPTLTMRSYDMQLTVSKDSIVEGLILAFAPVILSIWKEEKPASKSDYLQFDVAARPDEVGLGDDWKIWAEW